MADPVTCSLLFKALIGGGIAAAATKATGSDNSNPPPQNTNGHYYKGAWIQDVDWEKYPIDGYYY